MSAPLDELQWSSPEWIQMNGLNFMNVLEYFSESPFFDRSSNNQILRMQTLQNYLPQTHPAFVKNLEKMTGVEFVVAINKEPSFYLVRKQERLGVDQVRVMQDFYVININIYMGPSIFNILNTRMLNCVLRFKQSFDLLKEMNEFDAAQGNKYKIDKVNETIKSLEAETGENFEKETVSNGVMMDRLFDKMV